jgi:hypothetical protein
MKQNARFKAVTRLITRVCKKEIITELLSVSERRSKIRLLITTLREIIMKKSPKKFVS